MPIIRLLLVALIFLVTGTGAFSQQPSPSGRAAGQPEQQATTEHRGTEQAPFVVKVMPAPKTQQEGRLEAEDRKQKSRQEWLSLLFNGLLVAFTGLLFLSTVALWRTNKKTTEATKTLATIADTQLKDQRAIQRAYISAEPEGLHPLWGETREQHFVIGHVKFRNGGHIPARDFRWYAKIDYDENDRRECFPIPDVANFEGTAIIAPGSAMMFGTKEIELNPTKPTGWIYVWGAYTYNDGFVPNRFATFCHRYNRSALRKGASENDPPSRHGIPAENGRIHRFGNTEQK